MNILFLASTPYSHIIPLQPLIVELLLRGNTVYCVSDKKNKKIIESFGARFIEYPFDFEKDLRNIDYQKLMNEVNSLWKDGQYEEGFLKFTREDIKGMYNIADEDYEKIRKIIIDKKINIIFRDAVEKIGLFLSKEIKIPCIGYITHNLYSEKYFKNNSIEKTIVFLGAKKYKNALSNNFLENYYDIFANINECVSKELKQKKLYPLHQFDPRDDYTIIFSTKYLQPNISYYKDRKYKIIYPIESRFTYDDNFDVVLKKFLSHKEQIVYIASGTITVHPINYYIKLINLLIKMKFKIVVACGGYKDYLKEYVKSMNLEDEIYVSDFVPQKYVLNFCSLFITSGGQNSLIEAMYFQVPLLVTPITSEQRLNGLQIKDMNIGDTVYKISDSSETLGSMIYRIINDKSIKTNLKKYHDDLVNHKNNFQSLWEYLKDKTCLKF